MAVTWDQFHWSVQASGTILYNEFESYAYKITATSPRGQLSQLVNYTQSMRNLLRRLIAM